MPRCSDCRLSHLPSCAGEDTPDLCRFPASPHVAEASKALSSIRHGWPRTQGTGLDLAATDPHANLIAPRGTRDCAPPHEGRAAVKPWQRQVTVTIPHLGTPETLEAVVALHKLQTPTPHILIVDTGSSAEDRARIERLRCDDVEIHYIRGGGYTNSSEPVALACDFAQARCKTEYLFFTHADCFPMRRDLLKWFIDKCSSKAPVVGYGLTDRSPEEIARLSGADEIAVLNNPHLWTHEWTWMVGHTALMVHLPTIRRAGVYWGFDHARDCGAIPEKERYLDTEIGFNWSAKAAGLPIKIAGAEAGNYDRTTDERIDHVRSYSSLRLYGSIGPHGFSANAHSWMVSALADARDRITLWSAPKPRLPLGTPHCVPCKANENPT